MSGTQTKKELEMKTLIKGMLTLIVSIIMTVGSTSAQEFKLQFASYIGDTAAQSRAQEWWADEVEKRSAGRVSVDFFYRGSLLGARDMLQGVGDGRASMGYVANAYHPAELPLSTIVGVPFMTSNAEAQMRTFMDLYENNSDFREEWRSKNVHVLFFNPLSENILGTREQISGVDDLKGMRIRGLGYVNNVLDAVGANPIAIAATEIYEGMLRNTLDGYSGFAFEVVTALKLQEVAPHTTATGTGNYVFAATPINLDLWESMPEDIQSILTEVSMEYQGKVAEFLAMTEDEVCKTILDSGGTVTVFSDADVAKIRDAVGPSIIADWIDTVNSSGVDAEKFLSEYKEKLAMYETQVEYVPGVQRCANRN
jgi:TRAP-type C4-dicarboxylate transport system substrate-binding protein